MHTGYGSDKCIHKTKNDNNSYSSFKIYMYSNFFYLPEHQYAF